ncbi:phage baseplate protein [Burkholderia vietnamiensis]|uniref:phage baseplate protein n=1 Tax=Burkholderia vietnamiensis TaxID=60552 RepID=UPI001CF3E72A|nr:phage baseplate protein [Burkholderia vietnamiensis]MCA8210873.1 phage baseplate protein [Burkholderia vietnamiensis]
MNDFEHIRRPFQASLKQVSQTAADQKAWSQSKAWPVIVESVQGSIVTVCLDVTSEWTFPPIQMPLFGPEYIRYPIKKGDAGLAVPSDVSLGKVSGLGANTPPTLDQPPNLSAHVFLPCGNARWTPPRDPQAVEIYGPNGVILHDTASNSTITVAPDGITITTGGITATLKNSKVDITASTSINLTAPQIALNGTLTATDNSGGTATINAPVKINNKLDTTGPITAPEAAINGVTQSTHKHTGVQPGSGTSGGPTN